MNEEYVCISGDEKDSHMSFIEGETYTLTLTKSNSNGQVYYVEVDNDPYPYDAIHDGRDIYITFDVTTVVLRPMKSYDKKTQFHIRMTGRLPS